MAIAIIPGGCRKTLNGITSRQDCNTCVQQGTCQWEPQARHLAELTESQWVSAHVEMPPSGQAILYLEYPSARPTGTPHYGRYDDVHNAYVEDATGQPLSPQAVIAWMPVPAVPQKLYTFAHRSSLHSSVSASSGRGLRVDSSVKG